MLLNSSSFSILLKSYSELIKEIENSLLKLLNEQQISVSIKEIEKAYIAIWKNYPSSNLILIPLLKIVITSNFCWPYTIYIHIYMYMYTVGDKGKEGLFIFIFFVNFMLLPVSLDQLVEPVEYTDCISAEK